MKKLLIFLTAALLVLSACQKDDELSRSQMSLKKKPAQNNGQNGGGGSTYTILAPNGEDPLYINVGEIVELTVVPDLPTEWYVIDQQIAYVNWLGVVTGVAPGVTQISAFHYREHGNPYQDNLIVYVE